MDIREFLAARLDEDEAAAKAAYDAEKPADYQEQMARWRYNGESVYVDARYSSVPIAVGPWGAGVAEEIGQHIARWDPTRVLADIKAKRGIVERFHHTAEGLAKVMRDTPAPVGAALWERDLLSTNVAALLLACKLLAAPYADHPDFDPAWRMES